MWARVSTIQGSPQKLDEGIRGFRDEVLPAARELAGFKGAYFLADRQSGKFVAITLWETEGALRVSAAAANRLRAQAAESVGATAPPTVEVYEVAVKP